MNDTNNGINKTKSFAERFSKKPATEKSADNSESNQSFTQKYSNQSRSTTMNTESLAHKEKASNLTSAQADLVYLVKGIDNSRNAWYYVLVERLKLSLFLKALNDDIIHLENYGKILHSAYGDEPPEEITKQLKEEYGIN
jgi:hypothetical protein